ncbi:MAG: flagellar hook-length control protein FliK [Methylophaga sp.]|nr:flagellar hook-length control protein FliK [Methylophaga sp.]
MNAVLTIKTEIAASKSASNTSKAASVNDGNGFSQALEKQVQDNNKADSGRDIRAQKTAERQDNPNKAADKSDEAAVSASEDGKKLPPDDKEKNVTADSEQTEQSTETAKSADKTTEVEAYEADTFLEADTVVDSAENETDNNHDEASESSVTVAVAAPAIQNAATDKVTMTLSDNVKAQPNSEETASKNSLQKLTPVLNAEGDIETVDGKTRFADILKKDNAAQTAIRADILQAISQKTSNEDGDGQTLKTSLQNLLLGGENKAQPNGQAAELIRQIQPGQQRSPDNRTASGLVTALTPASSAPGQTSAAGAPQIAMDVQPQLNSAAWSRVVSSRVVWMAREGVQQAELRLNPANLGSVDVRLNISNDQASVTFLAQNAATREALEQSMPRLRESLAENGLSLTHSEVGQQDHPEQQASEDETSTGSAHLAKVSVALDDTEDELIADMPTENNEQSTGVSLYA